jgi:hypothetical protein
MAIAGASEVAPAQLVENYINLSAENPEQAKTLLLPDAAYLIFDYGGSLADNFPEFIKLLAESDCSKPLIQTEEKAPNAAGVDADVVRVEWQCTKPTEAVLASNVLRFIVTRQKIAGVVFEDPPGYLERRQSILPGDSAQ